MPLVDYLIQPGEMQLSPEAIDSKRKIAMLLQQQGSDYSPVQSWTQGAARVANALMGNIKEWKLDKAEKSNMERGNAVLSGLAGALMGGDTSSSTPASGATASGGGGDYFSTMAQKESGGNPNIKNAQGSGATGLYQFMPGTWRGLMEKYPNLGLTYDGMTDPQQQQAAMRQFTADNAKALQAAGVPVNNATLAIAHQQGAGGAIKLLTNPDAPAVNVVGTKAVTMNGGDPRMTAGQFAQKVAGYYMGGSQGLTDRLSPQAAQNVLSGHPGPVPGARTDMAAVAAPDSISPQAMQVVMTNQPGPVPGARTDMAASTMPMTLSPQAAGNVMSGQTGPVPGARLPVSQALADTPAAGAQPAGYQIPGQAPMPAPAAPAAMPAQANRAALMQKVIQAWPYLNESQRQQAQMILQMAPKPMTPLEQLQMQEAGLNIAAKQHEQQNWATSDAQAQANLDKTKNENSLFPTQSAQALANLDKTQKETARLGTTGDIDEYRFYQQDQQAHGLQPKSFNDWMLDKRKAGAITIDQRAEGAEETGRGQGLAKRLNDVADEGAKAQEDANLYQHFGSLLQEVQTGPSTNTYEKIRQLTGGVVNLDPKTDTVQAVNSLINYMAPRMRVAGSGSQSDRELGNFLQSMPTLYNTPGGNELINATLQASAEYRMKRAEIAQAWQTGDLSGKQATEMLQKLPSPYLGLSEKIAALRKQSGAGVPETGPNGAPTNLKSPVGQPLDNGWVDVGGGFKIRQK